MDSTASNPDNKIIPPSQSVAWWPVHTFVSALTKNFAYPLLGTPAWCALADDDPAKLASVLDGGCHHALRLELNQEARAEAAKEIAASADWRAIAQELTELRSFRAANPWSKPVAS